jgi:hypothetical protein
MKYIVLSLLCALAGCRSMVAEDTVGTHPDSSGWDALFSPDLSNADDAAGVWSVSNGVMTASQDQAVWTLREYDNFILDLECMTGTNANSGIVIYCSDVSQWIPNSIEIQIQDDFGDKWTTVGDHWRSGAIFGHLAPTKRMIKRPGEWNRYTITGVDSQVDVVLNGEHVASMDMTQWTSSKTNPDGSPIPGWLSKPVASLPTQGKIGLQGKHGGAPIWFRNIKIKELE